jgi:hypothetical protein
MLPTNTHSLAAMQIRVATEYCPKVLVLDPEDRIVTVAAGVKVICPAPYCITFIWSPMAKVDAGIVTTMAEALLQVTIFPMSLVAKV